MKINDFIFQYTRWALSVSEEVLSQVKETYLVLPFANII